MPRGGKSGLREHRRRLLHPYAGADQWLRGCAVLSSTEQDLFHQVHRIFDYAKQLGDQIWDVQDSWSLGIDAGVPERLLNIVFADHQEPREPVVADRSRSPVVRIAPTRTHHPSTASSRSHSTSFPSDVRDCGRVIVSFDWHDVLDKDFPSSVESLRELLRIGLTADQICVTSYAVRSDRKVDTTRRISSWFGEFDLASRVHFTGKPVGPWGKAQYLRAQYPDKIICHVDDRWDVIEDCRRNSIYGFHLDQHQSIQDVVEQILEFIRSGIERGALRAVTIRTVVYQ